jgi:hypothetical protein
MEGFSSYRIFQIWKIKLKSAGSQRVLRILNWIMFCTAWPQKFKQKPSVMLTICWNKGSATYLLVESAKYSLKILRKNLFGRNRDNITYQSKIVCDSFVTFTVVTRVLSILKKELTIRSQKNNASIALSKYRDFRFDKSSSKDKLPRLQLHDKYISRNVYHHIQYCTHRTGDALKPILDTGMLWSKKKQIGLFVWWCLTPLTNLILSRQWWMFSCLIQSVTCTVCAILYMMVD